MARSCKLQQHRRRGTSTATCAHLLLSAFVSRYELSCALSRGIKPPHVSSSQKLYTRDVSILCFQQGRFTFALEYLDHLDQQIVVHSLKF